MKRKLLLFAVVMITFFSCGKKQSDEYKTYLTDPELFHRCMKQLTDVIVYDIFSPPVASRIYAYPSVAAYEALIPSYPEKYRSLTGQLSGLDKIKFSGQSGEVNHHLASIHAFLKVGTAFIFSQEKMEDFQVNLYRELEELGLPESVKEASLQYGDEVADHILEWSKSDLYKETRSYPQYTVVDETHLWKPTPPDYMQGIEPHWNKIRTMVLDSARQFPPIEPHPFSLEEGSVFHKELMEVYEVGNNLDEEETAIAQFWDCNPFVSSHVGHAMYVTKKITPGGHWIGICAVASRTAKLGFAETVHTYTKTSIALFDAFISCWDEKWRSVVVRPETLINKFYDEDWTPLLQTPPFPEYTSGHSVISRAAAVTLTDLLGDNFAFNDTTELEYGLPERQFESFLQASEEAAISRLYGGIHYMMAIENGVDQGHKVGEFIVEELKMVSEEAETAKAEL